MHKSIGCIVMAAGLSRRYGANKLLAPFQGKPVIAHTLEAIPKERFHRVAVVSGSREILTLANERGFLPVENCLGEEGVSRTIRLGLDAVSPADGALFLVGDQPLLSSRSIEKVVDCWEEHPASIAALSHEGKRGNPCLFPAALFPALYGLTGDNGGNQVIKRHTDLLRLVEADPRELLDVDTPEALQKIQQTKLTGDSI